jgi:hypothetical protein
VNARHYLLAIAAIAWVLLTLQAISAAEERGARKARLERLTAQIETLEVRVEKLDTVFRDSVRYATKWRTRWDTVKATDTITRDSVVYVRLAPAESTINACFAALRSCERAGVAKDTLIRAQAEKISALESAKPSLKDQLVRGAIIFGAGYLTGRVW